MLENNLNSLKNIQLKLYEQAFDPSEFNQAIDSVFQSSHLNKRNLFFFKEGEPLQYELPKSFDLNFISNPLCHKKLYDKFLKEGFGMQIRGLQSCSEYFYKKSLLEFRKTFCLNNFNLYLSERETKSFKKHADPFHAFVYFLRGEKNWEFDTDSLVTKAGDILAIPKGVKHNVHSMNTPSLHITNSYYSLPLKIGSQNEIEVPILAANEYAEKIYEMMRQFFESNMSNNFLSASLFGDLSNLHLNYMFFHLDKPQIYIVGLGEVIFDNRADMQIIWNELSPDKKNISKDVISEIKNRLKS